MATSQEIGNQHGYLCPKCKSGESIRIAARVWADLLPDGADTSESDTEWTDTSNALCCDCLWEGKVSDLLTVEVDD